MVQCIDCNVLDDKCTPTLAGGAGDAAYDLACREDFSVFPGCSVKVPLGVAFKLTHDWKGILTHRSSMAFKFDCILSLGVIDSSFNSEVQAKVFNLGKVPQHFKAGDRIAQIMFEKRDRVILQRKQFDSTGKEGLGSSGGYQKA